MSHKIRRLTESDLRDAIDHLKYEMEMMKDVAILLSAGHQYSRIVGNALVESFVIHARALIMFLYYAPREDDDVMAVEPSDYRALIAKLSVEGDRLADRAARRHERVRVGIEADNEVTGKFREHTADRRSRRGVPRPRHGT